MSICNLSAPSCGAVSSLLSSQAFRLVRLDLSNSDLQDSERQLLSDSLQKPNHLQSARLEPAGERWLTPGLRKYPDGYMSIRQHRQKSFCSSTISHRVGVYLDQPAGLLSFYRVSSGSLVHLTSVRAAFPEPVYAGFAAWSRRSSLTLL
ncbi:unnamed protein product [Menidia menidia]|uniref:(Atlantic silverside) hypothetical protein n=1 Tax=Menidia menidia TaxID=238744 RepID=A0A8S4B9L8_9TELE|nr:unnamed protein product [Menidia menidia]